MHVHLIIKSSGQQWPTTSPSLASNCQHLSRYGRQLLARSSLLKRVSASCGRPRQVTVSQHHSSGMQEQHRRMATTRWQPQQQPQQHVGSHNNSHNNTLAATTTATTTRWQPQQQPQQHSGALQPREKSHLRATRASVFSLASAQRRRWMQGPPRRDVGHHWRHGQLLDGHCWHSVPPAVAMPVRHHEPQLHFQRLSCCAQTSAPSPPS
jgi:post-segregation antitoxin (ccd killing protein)